MNADRKTVPTRGSEPLPTPSPTHGSGQGANTALEALIRQRKLVESPEDNPIPPKPEQPRR
jgi:hypothetical protein